METYHVAMETLCYYGNLNCVAMETYHVALEPELLLWKPT